MGAIERRRVVVTGLGAVTPLGDDVSSSWEQLVAGRGAAGPITAFDSTGYAVTFACEAKDFEPTQWIERKQARRMDRFAQMIVAAAQQARADAGLEVEPECERIGVSVATAMGGLKSFEESSRGWRQHQRLDRTWQLVRSAVVRPTAILEPDIRGPS